MNHGADLEGRDVHGRTLLMEAAMHTDADTVKLIAGRMSQEALDEGDAKGNTALHLASLSDRPKVTLALLQSGVSPSIANKKGLRADEVGSPLCRAEMARVSAYMHDTRGSAFTLEAAMPVWYFWNGRHLGKRSSKVDGKRRGKYIYLHIRCVWWVTVTVTAVYSD